MNFNHGKTGPKKRVAVIGAGIFGITAALKLAEKGFSVLLLEKRNNLLMGASYINQNRIHMGYHYPRSPETVKTCMGLQKEFHDQYGAAAVGDFAHYYCVAKKNSKVTAKEYLDFCQKEGLPYELEFPSQVTMDPNKIDVSIRVPEHTYDANILRGILEKKLIAAPEVDIRLSTEVLGIKRKNGSYELQIKFEDEQTTEIVDSIVNATYTNINTMAQMAGFPVQTYQYELCEVPVIRVPWGKMGFAIMDGPFFGILPFGFSSLHLLYDVELSVLERSVGTTPSFKLGVDYYSDPYVSGERFKRYIEKVKEFVPEANDCIYLYSTYITRIVLPNRDHDDARPTDLIYHGDGFWSVFAGKILTALPLAEQIAEEMVSYFNGEIPAK